MLYGNAPIGPLVAEIASPPIPSREALFMPRWYSAALAAIRSLICFSKSKTGKQQLPVMVRPDTLCQSLT